MSPWVENTEGGIHYFFHEDLELEDKKMKVFD
jgi:hypothetical protein